MAAGIVTAKSLEAERAALRAETAALHRQLAEQEAEIGRLADAIAKAEAARGSEDSSPPAPAVAPLPAAKALPPALPDPAVMARAEADAQLSGLAIYARDYPEKGSRRTWLQAVDQLGRHLLPDGPVAEQRRAALADERGRSFAEARMRCLT